MKKPKFLQRFGLKRKIYQQELEYQEWQKRDALNRISQLEKSLKAYEDKAIQNRVEKERKKDELTDPFKQDNYEIVYKSNGDFKSVSFNGIPLNGVNSVEIETDGIDNDKPLLTLRVFGRINLITEEE